MNGGDGGAFFQVDGGRKQRGKGKNNYRDSYFKETGGERKMGDNFTDIMIKLTNDRYRQLEKTRY